MFESEIKKITTAFTSELNDLGQFVLFEDLTSRNLPPAILRYISAEIDYLIYEDRVKLLKNSVFDYSGEKIAYYFAEIANEIKKSKRFSREFIFKLVAHAVTFNVHFLARPNWTLTRFIFEDRENKTPSEIKQLLNYVYYYPYLSKVLYSYFTKKKFATVRIHDFEELLRKIDEITRQESEEKLIGKALDSLTDFYSRFASPDAPVPIKSVKLFAKEKNLNRYYDIIVRAFPDEGEFKSKNEILVALGLVAKEAVESVSESPEKISVTADENEAPNEPLLREEGAEVNNDFENIEGEKENDTVVTTDEKENIEEEAHENIVEEEKIWAPEQGTEAGQSIPEEIKVESTESEKTSEEETREVEIQENFEVTNSEEKELTEEEIGSSSIEKENAEEIHESEEAFSPLIAENIPDDFEEVEEKEEFIDTAFPEVAEESEFDDNVEEFESNAEGNEAQITENEEEPTLFEQETENTEEQIRQDELEEATHEEIPVEDSDEEMILEESEIPPEEREVYSQETEAAESENVETESIKDEEVHEQISEQEEIISEGNSTEFKTEEEILNETDEPEKLHDEEFASTVSEEELEFESESTDFEIIGEEGEVEEMESEMIAETGIEETREDKAEEEMEFPKEETTEEEKEEVKIESVEEESSTGEIEEEISPEPKGEEANPSEESVTDTNILSEERKEENVELPEKDETESRKLDIAKLMENKKTTWLIEAVFEYDMEEFINAMDILNGAETEEDALEKLEEIFNKYGIKPESKEGAVFREIITDYFERN